MKTVFKYNIAGDGKISMPIGAEVLSVGEQNNNWCLWALVDTSKKRETREFRVFGTGHSIDPADPLTFVGHIRMEGPLEFFVFEKV